MRYVALLRAVNVGGHVVKMDRLRRIFEAMRFAKVETFIASGNVLFDTRATDRAALERRIERRLERELGYDVVVCLRTRDELEATCAACPFEASEGRLSVGFLKSVPGAGAAERLRALDSDDDVLHLRERELYWLSRRDTMKSKVWRTPMEKVIGVPATMRSLSTVRKLVGRIPQSDS